MSRRHDDDLLGISGVTAEQTMLEVLLRRIDPDLNDGGTSTSSPEISVAPRDWREWLRELYPRYVTAPFAPHHDLAWEWLWSISKDARPRPFVGIFARGGAKSTTAELGTVALGVRGARGYGWYVRETQELADQSVANIAALLESDSTARFYPMHGARRIGKYGSSRGWRRNRLSTAGGFTIDALGLDTAVRGLKSDEKRPDLIVLDDIDGLHDTPAATLKKIRTMTQTVLPAGAPNLAVMAIQNLIIPNGIFSQIADGRADFLVDRQVVGPIPAMKDLVTESVHDPKLGRRRVMIRGGTPTWDGQNLEACQHYVDTYGYRAFMRECQHDVKEREGSLWKTADFRRLLELPKDIIKIAVAVDPSGGGDEIGIMVGGIRKNGRGILLEDRTQKGKLGPLNWGNTTVECFDDWGGDDIVAERNFGGDMVESTIKVSVIAAGGKKRHLPVVMVTASRGKIVRAQPVRALYGQEDQEPLIDHYGEFPELELEMTNWVPGEPSPNRMDALVWLFTHLFELKPDEGGHQFRLGS